eukprot:717891-Hanusia_phi.AAC.1
MTWWFLSSCIFYTLPYGTRGMQLNSLCANTAPSNVFPVTFYLSRPRACRASPTPTQSLADHLASRPLWAGAMPGIL